MGMSSPIVKTCAKVAGLFGSKSLCSWGHLVATAADMMASWLTLSKVCLLCYSAASDWSQASLWLLAVIQGEIVLLTSNEPGG